jgi:WD40 repeat protein
MQTPSRVLASLPPLASLALLVGCSTEPERTIAGVLANHTSTFTTWSDPVSLGSAINSSFNDQQAALSKDGLTLYFASNRPGTPGPGPNDIWVSHRDCLDCTWSDPTNLGAPLNTGANEAAPALSRDEHWLFFLSNRPGSVSSDIWVAWRENVQDDLGWEAPVNLGAGVNTPGFDGGPSYFENDDAGRPQLYFNHNPAPVNTGGDIYVSELTADGSFGPASPVTELNTSSSEQRPSIAFNGLAIYFFSDRPGSSGNDIWVSTREDLDAPWASPTNVGAPVNSSAGELHPLIVSHGSTEYLYFARNMATAPAQDLDLFVSTRTRGGQRGPQ